MLKVIEMKNLFSKIFGSLFFSLWFAKIIFIWPAVHFIAASKTVQYKGISISNFNNDKQQFELVVLDIQCSEKHFARIIETLHNFDPDGQLRILTCSEMAPKMSLFGLSNS